MTGHKRRGNGKSRKQYGGSDSEGESMEDQSVEPDNPSESPEVVSQPQSRRNSSVSMLLTESLPPLSSAIERREESSSTVLPPITHATSSRLAVAESRPELPSIATLSVPPSNGSREDPPSQSASKQEDSQMIQRRRTSSATSGKSRTAGLGSKIVACNVCRGMESPVMTFTTANTVSCA